VFEKKGDGKKYFYWGTNNVLTLHVFSFFLWLCLPCFFSQPENILVNHNCDFEKGLKLADFGSCRGIYSKQPYTEYISTRWYRAPECLLTDGYYGAEMDLWGVGCVFFEITSLYPLFPGTNELDQINRVHQILGTPSEKVMQKFKHKGAAHLDFNYPLLKPTGIAKLIPHGTLVVVNVGSNSLVVGIKSTHVLLLIFSFFPLSSLFLLVFSCSFQHHKMRSI
jgi:serine/threonine protein kinase